MAEDQYPRESSGIPRDADSVQARVEDLVVECLNRIPAEGRAAIEEILENHPDVADTVRRQLARLERLGLFSPRATDGMEPTAERFGSFRLLRCIGSGGMGVVYLADQEHLGRRVALKLIRKEFLFDTASRSRFRREAQAASRLDHPGICPIFEAGEVDGTPYIAMRYVAGETLAAQLARAREEGAADPGSTPTPSGSRGPSSRQKIAAVLHRVEKVARAVDAAHENGLIHRDLKPGNIMVTPDGKPVILDFGLARLEGGDEATLTQSGELMGTPAYMAPEQVRGGRGDLDRRSDVYALGVILYECLTLKRPFDAATRDRLYQQILATDPPDPRRLNPRISRDLKVLLETALEKDADRRYQTAEDLAEDLKRIRLDEPIRARPPGRLAKGWKWARRNPGKSMALLTAAVIGLALVGALVATRVARNRAVAGHLTRAETLLGEADHTGALEAVARAREQDPDSAAALELRATIERAAREAEAAARREAAMSAAAKARKEAAAKSREYEDGRRALVPRRKHVAALREKCFDGYASTETRAELSRLERELEAEEARLARLLQAAREALERAARHEAPYTGGGPSTETNAAVAAFILGRFQEALAGGNRQEAARLAIQVRRFDEAKRHEKTLLGRGTLTVTVEPGDAEAYLFRYESYETVRAKPDVVPRLVPVPTTGVGRVRHGPWLEAEDFCAGDLCLVITAVERDSLAAKAGLKSGDLVVRLHGQPCGDGLFVEKLSPSGAAAAAGVKVLDRLESLGGECVEGMWEWVHPPGTGGKKEEGEGATCTLVAGGIRVEAERKARLDPTFGLRPVEPVAVVEGKAPAAMKLTCLRGGAPVTLAVPAGERSGLGVEVTAYPLILSVENRVAVRKALVADPGSYLLLVRRAGFEDQRYCVAVPREGTAEAKVRLLEAGTTPPGFVYVPPGPFVYGGDPEAPDAGPRQVLELPGFFMARKEVTNREWFAFVNDPETQKAMNDGTGPARKFLPRQARTTLARRTFEWYLPTYGDPETPVLGVSWNDIQAYLKWRNRKATEAGEKWRYVLPTEPQWEKATRGVDGRYFPWGDRFDFSCTVGRYRKTGRPQALLPVPGGFESRDASPYGHLDLGGSRCEWCGNEHKPRSGLYTLRGGSWSYCFVRAFRSAERRWDDPSIVSNTFGFRLVCVPSP